MVVWYYFGNLVDSMLRAWYFYVVHWTFFCQLGQPNYYHHVIRIEYFDFKLNFLLKAIDEIAMKECIIDSFNAISKFFKFYLVFMHNHFLAKFGKGACKIFKFTRTKSNKKIIGEIPPWRGTMCFLKPLILLYNFMHQMERDEVYLLSIKNLI